MDNKTAGWKGDTASHERLHISRKSGSNAVGRGAGWSTQPCGPNLHKDDAHDRKSRSARRTSTPHCTRIGGGGIDRVLREGDSHRAARVRRNRNG